MSDTNGDIEACPGAGRTSIEDGASRRTVLKLAGLTGLSLAFGSSAVGSASAQSAPIDQEHYYTGTTLPREPATEEFFYDTGSGEISYYDGSEWQIFSGEKAVWDVRSRMDVAGISADEAFSDAIDNAEDGDTILFRDGVFTLEDAYDIGKSLTLEGRNGAEVELTGGETAAQIRFTGGGQTDKTGIADPVPSGSRLIPVEAPDVFSPGDRVMLRNADYDAEVDTQIHFARVQGVRDGSLELDTATFYDFDAAADGGQVAKVDLLQSPTIKGLTAFGGADRVFQFKWCEDPVYEDIDVREYNRHSARAMDCWKPRWTDVTVKDPVDGRGPGEGEAIQIYRCAEAAVYSPRIYDCRRGIDLAWGSYGVTIVDPVVHNFSLKGISVHQDQVAGNVAIFGGTLIADTVPPADVGFTGSAISGSPSAEFHVEGTHIKTRRYGLNCNCEFTASGVHVEPVEDVSNGAAARITHSDVQLRGLTVTDAGNDFSLPPIDIRTEGEAVENVTVDASIDVSHRPKVQVLAADEDATIDGLTFRGEIRCDENDGRAVRIDSDSSRISRVDWSMDVVDHGGNCLVVIGDEGVEDLKIHDCTMTTTGNACVGVDGGWSEGNQSDYVWITDNYLLSDGNTVALDDPVGSAWVTDNRVDNVYAPGVSDLVERGNMQ